MNWFELRRYPVVLLCCSLLSGQVCVGADKGLQSKTGSSSRKKIETYSPENIHPDSEVPLNPERYIWKLSTKRSTLDKNSKEVPIYMFAGDGHERVAAGGAPIGELITLDSIRLYGHRHFYRYNRTASEQESRKFGPSVTFWIDGMNIDYAGKK
jgi:hypothetical protein